MSILMMVLKSDIICKT